MSQNNCCIRFIVRAFILFSFLSAIFPAQLCADDEQAKRIITDYIKAVQADDPVLIKTAWTALNDDEEALNYMKIYMPKLDYLFGIRGLSLDIQDIQESYPEYLEGQESATISDENFSPGAVEVEKFSVSEPDKTERRTNRDIVMEAQGRTLVDNGTIALNNPNQNRTDNEDFVRSRKNVMFAEKFQQAPKELVPRGSSFPKASSPAVSATRVQGLSTTLVIQKSSGADQLADLFLNDSPVERNLLVSEKPQTVSLYLSQGTNLLKVSRRDRMKGSTSFTISIEGTTAGKKDYSLTLRPGQSQEIRIEAVP